MSKDKRLVVCCCKVYETKNTWKVKYATLLTVMYENNTCLDKDHKFAKMHKKNLPKTIKMKMYILLNIGK